MREAIEREVHAQVYEEVALLNKSWQGMGAGKVGVAHHAWSGADVVTGISVSFASSPTGYHRSSPPPRRWRSATGCACW